MKTYNIKDLDQLSLKTGFIRDNLEKVLRLIDILAFINDENTLKDTLALKGGTAINLTVFDIPRLSVDLDFDFTVECDRDKMLKYREMINKIILHYMASEGYQLNQKSKNPHSLDSWAFYYRNSGGNQDNIKIEINYSMRCHVMPIVDAITTADFTNKLTVRTLSPIELFGSKIKAFIERSAARDLYDIHNLLTTNIITKEDTLLLRKIVVFYLAVGGSNSPSASYNFSKIDDIEFKQIRANLLPMLHKSTFFELDKTKDDVKDYLTTLIVLSDDEKQFVEKFNANIYMPQLLFGEWPDICERVKKHPMAIWKTKNNL